MKLIKYLLLGILILSAATVTLVIDNDPSLAPEAIYELRGRYVASPDGKTYLVIEDDNGGQCGPLLIDNRVWSYGVNNKGEVKPGTHRIECGSWVDIIIQEGTTYYFNYWGP